MALATRSLGLHGDQLLREVAPVTLPKTFEPVQRVTELFEAALQHEEEVRRRSDFTEAVVRIFNQYINIPHLLGSLGEYRRESRLAIDADADRLDASIAHYQANGIGTDTEEGTYKKLRLLLIAEYRYKSAQEGLAHLPVGDETKDTLTMHIARALKTVDDDLKELEEKIDKDMISKFRERLDLHDAEFFSREGRKRLEKIAKDTRVEEIKFALLAGLAYMVVAGGVVVALFSGPLQPMALLVVAGASAMGTRLHYRFAKERIAWKVAKEAEKAREIANAPAQELAVPAARLGSYQLE